MNHKCVHVATNRSLNSRTKQLRAPLQITTANINLIAQATLLIQISLRTQQITSASLATNGISPYGMKSLIWSSWPVYLLNYNVPSWFTTNKHFIMLLMIIRGKESVVCETFNVYLQPMIEELHILWTHGIRIFNAGKYGDSDWINFRVIFLWTIHDSSAYGIVTGCVTKGYKSCHVYGPSTISRRSAALKKNLNDNQARRWLPIDHH